MLWPAMDCDPDIDDCGSPQLDTPRQREAAEFPLDQFGEVVRRAIVEVVPEGLDADRRFHREDRSPAGWRFATPLPDQKPDNDRDPASAGRAGSTDASHAHAVWQDRTGDTFRH